MDYAAIAVFLKDYLSDITSRYQEFNRSGLSEEDWQQQVRSQGRVMSVISEEMTNWEDRLPGNIGGKFFKAAMSDSRKVLLPPLFVAHDRTLTCLGDAKGLAKLRDSSLLELELIPTIHATTRKPVASGKGRLKLPGHLQWLEVELPKIERKITDFSQWSASVQPPVQQPSPDFRNQILGWLGDCWNAEAPISPTEDSADPPLSALPKHLQQIIDKSRELGWLNATVAKSKIWVLRDKSPDEIRRYFRELEVQGLGQCRGENSGLEFKT